MKHSILFAPLCAIGLACSMVGCAGDSGEWLEDLVAAHDSPHESDGTEAHPGETPECPDVCEAICAGLPEPETPPSCPIPACGCEPPPTCPDVCAAICVGAPEPEVPSGCAIPICHCD